MPVEYPFRNYLFLFGASAKAEVVNYVRTQCVPEEEQRLGDTLAAWVGANKHFREVEQAEIGEPEQIDLREIPEESSAEIKKVESDFLFIVPGARRRMHRGLVQLENTLSMIRENLNPEVSIQGILPTMYDKRLLHSKEAVDILKENFGDLVFKTKIRKTIRYAEAPVKGQSVLGYDPSGDAAELYRDLAKEVLNGAKAREHA